MMEVHAIDLRPMWLAAAAKLAMSGLNDQVWSSGSVHAHRQLPELTNPKMVSHLDVITGNSHVAFAFGWHEVGHRPPLT